MRLIVESGAFERCRGGQGLLALIAARAICLISTTEPSAALAPDLTAEEIALASFVDKCACALTSTSPSDAPKHARNLVLTFILGPGKPSWRSAVRLALFLQAVHDSLGNLVPSCSALRKPGEWRVQGQKKHDALQRALKGKFGVVEWQTAEQWAGVWEEGEGL